jgi:hypothetical protein
MQTNFKTLLIAFATLASTALAYEYHYGSSACLAVCDVVDVGFSADIDLCSFFFRYVATFNLPPDVGACGRPCNTAYTCVSTGRSQRCTGGSAAVHRDIFFRNFNESDPDQASNPACQRFVNSEYITSDRCAVRRIALTN